MTPIHICSIKNGTIIPTNPDRYHLWLGSLEGQQVEVVVRKAVSKRTIDQNALLWKYYELIADETGDDVDSIHEFLKRKLLPPQFIKTKWGEAKIPASTTTLSTIEFSQYLDRINALTGVPIPSKDWEL